MSIIQRTARQIAEVVGRESMIIRSARPLYERALAALSGGGGIPWTINGEPFRISPFHRHRMGEVYDPAVAEYLGARVAAGSTCLDIGANVGIYALQFARWTGDTGRVLAFEPNPVSAGVLREHMRMNGYEGRVQVVPAAVSSAGGSQVFHMDGADGMSRLGQPNPEIAARTCPTEVNVVSVDGYCAAHRITPDWMLIDVEGFEFAVLAGARETIAARRPRLGIVVEMHPNAWSVAGWTRDAGAALLEALRLRPVSLTGAADPLADYGHVVLVPIEGLR